VARRVIDFSRASLVSVGLQCGNLEAKFSTSHPLKYVNFKLSRVILVQNEVREGTDIL